MKTTLPKILRNSGIVIISIAGIFCLGYFFGSRSLTSVVPPMSLANVSSAGTSTTDFGTFWKVWNLINEKSPDANKISDQDRVWGATEGLVASLGDPYSVFFPPSENKEFNEQIEGQFSGVGMEIGVKDKIITVIAPLKGTPAEKAGIKSGDRILKIDTTSTNDMAVDKAISLIRGPKGTSVKLSIYRDGDREPRTISIIRDNIEIPTLDGKLRPDGVYVISLYNFSANASELFTTELAKFAKTDSTRLIIDLRQNPGGYLDAAIDMGSYFLPEGTPIVIENFGSSAPEKIYRSRGTPLLADKKIKIAILVDGGSASASEILAGALSENKVAKLFGLQTYGKGSVQELIPVTDDTSLKITIAKWLTPNRISISEKGLTPDVVVNYPTDLKSKTDPQMDAAVKYLLAK